MPSFSGLSNGSRGRVGPGHVKVPSYSSGKIAVSGGDAGGGGAIWKEMGGGAMYGNGGAGAMSPLPKARMEEVREERQSQVGPFEMGTGDENKFSGGVVVVEMDAMGNGKNGSVGETHI